MPLIWLRGDFLFASEESGFANYQRIIDKNLFSWNEKENYGLASAPGDHTMIMPNGLFYKILSVSGLDNHHIQIIFLQIFLLASLLAISYLLRLFTNNKAIILAGSLLYLFNYYFTSTIFQSAKMFQLILLPLFFLFLYKFLKTEDYKYAIYNFLSFFLLQAIFCNLPQLATTLFVYIIAVSFFILAEKISWFYFLKKYFLKLLSFFVLLVPIFIYQGLVLSLLLNNFSDIRTVSTFQAIGAPLWQIFQFRGGWWEYAGFQGLAYNCWLFFYDNIFVILHSFLVFALAISFLFLKKTRSAANLVLFSFLLIFILFASGSSFRPGIYLWFYDHFPFFYIFREPFSKFMPLVLLLVVILLAISLDDIYKRFKNKISKKLFIAGALLLVLVGCLPLFSSNFFDRTNSGWKKTFIKLPAYWQEYSSWSNGHQDSFILPYPFLTEGFDLDYKWYDENLGNSNARVYNIFGNSNFIGDYYSPIAPYNKILKIFAEKNNFNFVKLGTVDYLLEQNDVDQAKIKKLLEWESGVKRYFKEENFKDFDDKLSIHKIKNEYFLPLFYTPLAIISSSAEPLVAGLPEIVSSPDHLLRSVVYPGGQDSLIPTELASKSSFFTFLFNNSVPGIKATDLILNKYQASNIFTLKKTIDPNSFVDLKYSSKTNKLSVFSRPTKEIFINDQEISGVPMSLLELKGSAGDFLKIGDNFICLQSGYSKSVRSSKISSEAEIYQVKIIKPIELPEASFEEGLWQEIPGDCSLDMAGKAEMKTRLSRDATHGRYSLELQSKNHVACVQQNMAVNLKKNKLYKYSFDYKNVKGNKIAYYYNLIGQGQSYPFGETIAGESGNWNHYETIIKPEEDINRIFLYFYSSADGKGEVINRYDNIRLSEISMDSSGAAKTAGEELPDILVIKDNIKLDEGENKIEYRGDLEAGGILPKDIYNYYLESNIKELIAAPILEFKKINPIKYRVRIRGASGKFPLIFNQNFSEDWKMYLTKDGAAAGLEESNAVVSQGTIQNNDLPAGNFWETWFKEPFGDEADHLVANGYANSWLLDTDEICRISSESVSFKEEGDCLKNPDGTYDFEVVVEFWPQRLFYMALFISGMTLLSCFVYLGYASMKKRKKRKEEGAM